MILGLGMLGAAACSGCMPPANTNNSNTMQQQSMNCGAYTHRVGNQCVGDSYGNTSGTSSRSQPSTLKNSSGN